MKKKKKKKIGKREIECKEKKEKKIPHYDRKTGTFN